MTWKDTGANVGILYGSLDVTHRAQGQKEAAFVQIRITLQQNSEDTQNGKYLATRTSARAVQSRCHWTHPSGHATLHQSWAPPLFVPATHLLSCPAEASSLQHQEDQSQRPTSFCSRHGRGRSTQKAVRVKLLTILPFTTKKQNKRHGSTRSTHHAGSFN